ncbi:hypothetical protein PHPALM_28306 [Phytophthora palmivora]|uniref:Uncharacterized protein n=1 Tax=Phytophthora palmivora TaxID=4796 RepID=A0A2P4XAE8_9STRA|nr:hypothetical protein PHPALM_28306 [Phytophthora palmivora]
MHTRNNANSDQGGRPRVSNDQTDQNVEGDLAEWGYTVQYEDGREERRKTTTPMKTDPVVLCLISELRRSRRDRGKSRTNNLNFVLRLYRDSLTYTDMNAQKRI